MDDETSSRYIFLFMLLLIPFLIIGLSIEANLHIVSQKLNGQNRLTIGYHIRFNSRIAVNDLSLERFYNREY